MFPYFLFQIPHIETSVYRWNVARHLKEAKSKFLVLEAASKRLSLELVSGGLRCSSQLTQLIAEMFHKELERVCTDP